MRWIRQKMRCGAGLALFALALHMVVSFGHVHADLLTTQSAVAAVADAADIRASDLPAPPSAPYHGSAAHDFCAVCASIAAFGSLVLPALSALATRREFAPTRFAPVLAAALPPQTRSFNQARGPPSA
jgi:hypothetical protein